MNRDVGIRADIEQSLAWWRAGGEGQLRAENRRLKAEAARPRCEIGAEIYKALLDQRKVGEQAGTAEQAARQKAITFRQEVRDDLARIEQELTQTREDVLVDESITKACVGSLQEQMDWLSHRATRLMSLTHAWIHWQRRRLDRLGSRVDWLSSRVTSLIDRLTPRPGSARKRGAPPVVRDAVQRMMLADLADGKITESELCDMDPGLLLKRYGEVESRRAALNAKMYTAPRRTVLAARDLALGQWQQDRKSRGWHEV
jgi:hypothetical protein